MDAGTPVPVNETICGEFAALSAMLMVIANAVADSGVKLAVMVQCAPTARVEPQLFGERKAEGSPVRVKPVKFSVAPPVLVIVTVWVALVVFTT